MCLEVLAPAGNLEKLKIAQAYGADAVYLAGQRFGLRSAADNFTLGELSQARDLTQAAGIKMYLAINAHLLDWELEQLPEYLQELKKFAPDAVIVSDLGVAKLVEKHLGVPLHVSTQASVLNSEHARIWQEAGAKRIVAGRELSIEEASKIKAQTGLEMELFIQGALCMSYSGHCVISNYLAARDSNRGGCIQSCRYKYSITDSKGNQQDAFFMNSKDLRGLELLPAFLEAGIDSVKIEGRMKSNLYLATTLRAYRGALRDLKAGQTDRLAIWEKELEKIPNRDYTTGNLAEVAGFDSVHHTAGEAISHYSLAGTVLYIENQMAWFQARNSLGCEDQIEFLSPQGEVVLRGLKGMKNAMGEELERLQPGQLAQLPAQGLQAYMVGRKQTLT